MTTLTIEISDETYAELKAPADDAQMSVHHLVRNMIQANLLDEDDEPTDEEILQSIRRGMIQALNGEGRPARDVLDEIDTDDEDTPDEEIINDIRQSLKDYLAGNVRPLEDVLDELRREIFADNITPCAQSDA